MWHYQSYDEGRTDSGKTSSGRNPAFNLYLYIFIHYVYIFFCHTFVTSKMLYCNLYLLSFIVTMYLKKFLCEQYSNSRVLIHYIEGHCFIVFFVSILGFHFILCYINNFPYLQIQLYDTLSLSPSRVMDIVLYK